MTTTRLVLIGLLATTLAMGCGEESTSTPDAAVLPTPDAAVSRDTGLPDIAQGGTIPDAAPVDMAPSGTPDAPPAVDLAPDASPLPPDAPPLPPDATTLPPDATTLPPDATTMPPDAAPTTVMVTTCAQINCPALTNVASQCNGNDTTCTSEVQMTLPKGITNYCHSNGVKKYSETTYSGANGQNYTTVMRVVQPSGAACYTLELSGTDNNPLQNWIFKSPAGQELARATWNETANRLTLICGGVNYVIGDIGCPGTDGEPSGLCTAGTCD